MDTEKLNALLETSYSILSHVQEYKSKYQEANDVIKNFVMASGFVEGASIIDLRNGFSARIVLVGSNGDLVIVEHGIAYNPQVISVSQIANFTIIDSQKVAK